MKNKPILYIEINFVLADLTTGIERISLNDFKKGNEKLFDLTGIYTNLSPTPGAIEACRKLSANYDIYFVYNNTQPTPGEITDIEQWIKKNLGKEAALHFIVIPHLHLLKGDYLIYYANYGTPLFEGKTFRFELEHPEIQWKLICQTLIDPKGPSLNRHLTFPITVEGKITLLKESWSSKAEHHFMYEFDEKELRILAQDFQGLNPEDNVANLVDENLWKLNDFIYEHILNFANSQTCFNGEPEDILKFLYDYYAYFPLSFVKTDIAKGIFTPSHPDWQHDCEESLIAEWCDWRRETFHKINFQALILIFQQEYDAPVKFVTNADYNIYFPQELYDFIKKENERITHE